MSLSTILWEKCLNYLRDEIPPQQYNTWIRPLHVVETHNNGLLLLAPNRFVLDWINERFLTRINELLTELAEDAPPPIKLEIGSKTTDKEQSHNASAGTNGTTVRSPLAKNTNGKLRFGSMNPQAQGN